MRAQRADDDVLLSLLLLAWARQANAFARARYLKVSAAHQTRVDVGGAQRDRAHLLQVKVEHGAIHRVEVRTVGARLSLALDTRTDLLRRHSVGTSRSAHGSKRVGRSHVRLRATCSAAAAAAVEHESLVLCACALCVFLAQAGANNHKAPRATMAEMSMALVAAVIYPPKEYVAPTPTCCCCCCCRDGGRRAAVRFICIRCVVFLLRWRRRAQPD